MTGNDRERRPCTGTAPQMVTTTDPATVPPRYGRRPQVFTARPRTSWSITCEHRDFCLRSEPLPDGRRDPDLVAFDYEVACVLPFGLDAAQLERERLRLIAQGWSPGETVVVLGPVAS